MNYNLNLLDENIKNSTDIEVLNNACEYYKMMLHYLEAMKETEDTRLFYRLLNECYYPEYTYQSFTEEVEELLDTKSKKLITEIRKYDNNGKELEPVYFETWHVLTLDEDTDINSKRIYSKEEVEKLCNMHKILVLSTGDKTYIERVNQKYVNIHNNHAYYMGNKINLDSLHSGYLTNGVNPKSDSYYYIENYEPLVTTIREKFFSKRRLQEDIEVVESILKQYYLILRYEIENQNTNKKLMK